MNGFAYNYANKLCAVQPFPYYLRLLTNFASVNWGHHFQTPNVWGVCEFLKPVATFYFFASAIDELDKIFKVYLFEVYV